VDSNDNEDESDNDDDNGAAIFPYLTP